MCGRYATTTNPGRLAADLDAIDETGENDSRGDGFTNYNVAPTTQVLTVVARHDRDHPDDDPRLRVRRMRWGLIPVWTKAAEPGVPVKGKPLFNARADKAATTASFRDAVKYRRCLVPMDGWYEWLVEPDPIGGAKGKAVKRPYYMADADGSRLYMAGLWSVWRDRSVADSEPLLSCTILTTDAVGELTRIHDRMPLPMPREHWDAWLDPDHPAPASLLETPSEEVVASIVARPVSTLVNSVRNNGPELLAPVDGAPEAAESR
ncbi:SOS response-associated peptidase [Nocardia puris]|uniref:Abasic site processing protein n=1 Tax=Nocardia puris TaxID=208602 RepID=A0A366DQT0_9NOCA|nr:SOS response-associated peptidase [Nocardia puris]MBF6364627.1 SOS response-associated peptidase [Nocardia puris]MBF6459556.1 SOS response-associated peptidase [Nocardia puris]RBO92461.1 putative SOS response-associated peptidase YedK [Nocardia puris]